MEEFGMDEIGNKVVKEDLAPSLPGPLGSVSEPKDTAKKFVAKKSESMDLVLTGDGQGALEAPPWEVESAPSWRSSPTEDSLPGDEAALAIAAKAFPDTGNGTYRATNVPSGDLGHGFGDMDDATVIESDAPAAALLARDASLTPPVETTGPAPDLTHPAAIMPVDEENQILSEEDVETHAALETHAAVESAAPALDTEARMTQSKLHLGDLPGAILRPGPHTFGAAFRPPVKSSALARTGGRIGKVAQKKIAMPLWVGALSLSMAFGIGTILAPAPAKPAAPAAAVQATAPAPRDEATGVQEAQAGVPDPAPKTIEAGKKLRPRASPKRQAKASKKP